MRKPGVPSRLGSARRAVPAYTTTPQLNDELTARVAISRIAGDSPPVYDKGGTRIQIAAIPMRLINIIRIGE